MSTDLVVGLTRRTSYSLIRELLGQKRRVVVSDISDSDEKKAIVKELSAYGELTDRLGTQEVSLLDEFSIDRVIPSPGVPVTIPLIQEAKYRGITVTGDIEVFYQMHPDLIYAAVTGTDGKSTTVSLLADMVERERKCFTAGNIGTAIFEAESRVKSIDTMVLELSSFQLETVCDFKPKVAAILNVAEDHMDRYDSFKSYREAKMRIFINQNEDDILVLNADDPSFVEIKKQVPSSVLTFSLKDPQADAFFDGSILHVSGQKLINRYEMGLVGIHNVANALAAALMAQALGIGFDSIRNTLKTFKGLEHRMEFVREINGVRYYNDSKATTVNALEKALLSFEAPICLIAGGRDKDLNFDVLAPLVKQKVKKLILIGEAAEKIADAWKGCSMVDAKTMDRAVCIAKESCSTGDVVLLSPACASFDQFNSYTERGKVFKSLVNDLSAD